MVYFSEVFYRHFSHTSTGLHSNPLLPFFFAVQKDSAKPPPFLKHPVYDTVKSYHKNRVNEFLARHVMYLHV